MRVAPLHLIVENGEIFGFLGPNGAEKTTTLKMLMGLVFPTAERARILGKEFDGPRGESADWISSRAALLLRLSDRPRTAELLRAIVGSSGQVRLQERMEATSRAGRADRRSDHVQLRKFSKGMLQRAGIAQAILHDPKVVFFDEPMSGLEPLGRREVRDLIEELKRQGKTVSFSTHILSDAEALCDRVAVINQGELRGVGRDRGPDLERAGEGGSGVARNEHPTSLKALGAECHVTGETVRAVLPESQQDAAIDALRRERIRLIAIIPLRTSLEAYFVEKLQHSRTTAGTVA